jgi:calcium-dependent protein kinase
MAPEIIEKEYNDKCDVWSIGIIGFSLLTGKEPFWDEFSYNILKKVKIE